MSFKTTMLPEKMLRMISAVERQKMGKSAMLSSEAQAKIDSIREKELQTHCLNLLRQRGIPFISPTFGKKTRIKVGWPDVTFCLNGLFVACEFKVGKNGLSKEQAICLDDIRKAGGRAYVVQRIDEFLAVLSSPHQTFGGE